MTTEHGRRLFGAAAEAYDTGRPGYHPALVPTVLTYATNPAATTDPHATLGPGGVAGLGATAGPKAVCDPGAVAGPAAVRHAVEVGAGTGKATVAFAAAGIPVVAVEPDPQMADVLRANTQAFPHVTVEVAAFEDWHRADRRFDLLLAATSWHWIDPARRWTLAASALRPGGVLALFWNPLGVLDPALHADLAAVDREHGITDSTPHTALAADYGPEAGDWSADGMWPAPDLRTVNHFSDVREIRFRQEITYRTADYLKHLDSVGTYRRLAPEVRAAALAATAAVLDDHGGLAHMQLITDLLLARAIR